jgi:AcrR family transcriptional regulator
MEGHPIPVASPEPGKRGRPRRQSTDDQIIDAALALVREGGPQKVTVESVAARSSVARTTIYRRYRDRDELLKTALHRIADQAVPPEHLSVRDKVRWVLTRVRVILEEGLGRGGVAAVLADSHPQFTEAFRSTLAQHLEPLKTAIAADAENGLLRADVDADVALNLFFGSYLGEVLRYGEPSHDWLDRTLDMLVPALYAADQS